MILGLAVLVELRLATDSQTDGWTDGRTDRQSYDDSIYRASIASRGKNGHVAVSGANCHAKLSHSKQLLKICIQ